MKKFLTLSLLLILTRIADAQTTYFYTPNLNNEANPLVSKLGLNWTNLIISQAFLLVILIYSLWVYCFKTVQVQKFDRRVSMRQFISLFYFGDTKSFWKSFYKFPTNKNSLLYSIGFIGTYSLIFISIIVSFSTTLLLTNKSYKKIYSGFHLPTILYSISVLIIIYFAIKFFNKEYKARIAN